jgi:proteasome lid subunit RPN8/RPN11
MLGRAGVYRGGEILLFNFDRRPRGGRWLSIPFHSHSIHICWLSGTDVGSLSIQKGRKDLNFWLLNVEQYWRSFIIGRRRH